MTGTITLTGFIYLTEEGMLMSHCNELDIDTCADSIEELRQRTRDMINAYFAASRKLGTIVDVLERLGASTTG